MKRLFLFLFAFNLMAVSAIAQDDATVKDPKAKAILDKLSAKSKGFKSLKGEFTYRMVNVDEQIDESQKGNLYMQGDKYRLEIAGQIVISDGTKLITLIPDAEEGTIDELPDDADNWMAPQNLFTMYEKGFKYKHEGEATVNGKTVHIIKMFPENASETPYHTVILKIDKANNDLVQIEIWSKDGNKYFLTLDKLEANPELAPELFAPKLGEYEMEDMR